MSDRRAAFARAAEVFVGVPFRFRGRDPTTGFDCVGLVAAALETLASPAPAVPPYAIRQRDFAAHLSCASGAGFEEADGLPRAGDLLLVAPGPAQVHLGVIGSRGDLIHAHAGLGKVVATPPPCPWPIERHWRLRQD